MIKFTQILQNMAIPFNKRQEAEEQGSKKKKHH
jgi:hypothetical protein